MTTSNRLSSEHRKRQILTAAGELATTEGLYNFSSTDVGLSAGCSTALVLHHFTSMIQLRNAVIDQAVADHNSAIIAQALVKHDPQLDNMTKPQRKKHMLAAVV